MGSHLHPVGKGGRISGHVQPAHAKARPRNQRISAQYTGRQRPNCPSHGARMEFRTCTGFGITAPSGRQCKQPATQIAQPDSLQHSRDAQVVHVKQWKSIEKKPHSHQECAARQNMESDPPETRAALRSRCKGERHRAAREEEKRRKDHIRRVELKRLEKPPPIRSNAPHPRPGKASR